jgi:hypothetical protein
MTASPQRVFLWRIEAGDVNLGESTTSPISVDVWVDGAYVGTCARLDLEKEKTYTGTLEVDINLGSDEVLKHHIKVTVDPRSTIKESREDNNTSEWDFTLGDLHYTSESKSIFPRTLGSIYFGELITGCGLSWKVYSWHFF